MISHEDLLRFVKTNGSCLLSSPSDALPAVPGVSQSGDRLKVDKPFIKQEVRKPPNFQAKFVTPKIEIKNYESKNILKELKIHKGKHHLTSVSTEHETKKPTLMSKQRKTINIPKASAGVSAMSTIAIPGMIAVSTSSTAGVSAVSTSSTAGVGVMSAGATAGVRAVSTSAIAGVSAVSTRTTAGVSAVSTRTTAGVSAVSRSSTAGVSAVSKSFTTGVSAVSKSFTTGVSAVSKSFAAGVSVMSTSATARVSAVSTSATALNSAVSTSTPAGVSAVSSRANAGLSVVSKSAIAEVGFVSTSDGADIGTDSEHDLSIAKDGATNDPLETVAPPVISVHFKCDNCDKIFSYLKRFLNHQRQGICNQQVFMCARCDQTFGNLHNLKRHVKRVHEKIIFQCEVCRKLFPTKKTVDKHIKSNHNLNECKLCSKSYKNSNSLRTHVNKSHAKKPDKTKIEETTDKIEDNADEFVEDSHEDAFEEESQPQKKPVVISKPKSSGYQRNCDICGKTYYSRGGYSRHMLIHRNDQDKDIIPISEDALTAALGVNYVFVHDDSNQMVAEDNSLGTFGTDKEELMED